MTTTSHKYNPRAALLVRAAITLATSSGDVARMVRRLGVGGLAEAAGFRSVTPTASRPRRPRTDGVDAADGALGYGLADMRAAAGQLAVMASTRTSDREARPGLVRGRLACDRRRPGAVRAR